MKVYVAEKPSLGRAIADQLMKQSPKVDSGREFIVGSNWAVVWAAGHIFEQAEPDHYLAGLYPGAKKNARGKFSWTFDHLPLVPGLEDWAINLVPDKAALFKTIKQYVTKASIVVNAGDPDREGQLLIDEILHEIGNKKPVKRVLISGYDELSVVNGIKNEKDNSEFRGMSDAALARSRADWLCGMNFSRAATLQAQASGYPETISIGRVQTPILGLVVQRHLEIVNFKPVDYYSIVAKLKVATGEFLARWRPHEGQAGLDEDGRLLDRRVADQLNTLVSGKTGKIIEYSDEEKQEGPALPFSLDKLQILASRKYGYKSEDVLEAVQSLYERHKLTSYPRSDCQYLPVAQLDDAPMVFDAVKKNINFDAQALSLVDTGRKSRAWNDDKVTAHHAIIPTGQVADISRLSAIERDLYDEICRRYLAQFMPNRRYRAVSATADVCGQRFVATGTTTISPGWRVIYGAADEESLSKSADEGTVLPPMAQGDATNCLGLNVDQRKTTPPKYFTDASLLEAMINVHKFVTDEKVKAIFMKMLSDKKGGDEDGACGLGTPATRHTFVPKLIDIGLIQRQEDDKGKGKKAKESFLVPTAAGVALVQALPPELAKPDMTALWEASMREIEANRTDIARFLQMQAGWIGKTIDKIKAAPMQLPDPPVAKRKTYSGVRKPAELAGVDCPKCGAPMHKRKGPRGDFFGCSKYPECKHIENIS